MSPAVRERWDPVLNLRSAICRAVLATIRSAGFAHSAELRFPRNESRSTATGSAGQPDSWWVEE